MSLVKSEFVNHTAILRFNDPGMLNAISLAMVEAMNAALDECEAKSVRAIVITGEGRAFCSGASLTGGDLSVGGGFDAGAGLESHYNPLMMRLRNLPIPFVTAVHGAAAGIGCSLALIGDLIVADSTAYFLQAFRNIGLVPDGGSPFLLASAAGRPRAMEAMLLGERIPAQAAYEWGMINRLAPEGKDIEVATELAHKLAEGPTTTLAMIRKLAWGALEVPFEKQLADERAAQKRAGGGAEFREGITAFVEKRKARFSTTGAEK
jgi:2-(1,2-epoxy-1,2-dihydrophenyl)acetyl-CoA isomerase